MIAAYAEEISYDEFTPIYELPDDTTIWRIFNTGEQTILWSEFPKPAVRGEKSYHTLLAHSAEVPVIIANQIHVRRTNQDSRPRVEILWTRSKEPSDMARVAGGLYLGKHIVTTASGKGVQADISGQTVEVNVLSESSPTLIRTGQVQFDNVTPKIIGSGEVQAVTIKGLSNNSGDIYIGAAGISGNDSYILGPDGTVQTDIDNLNRIFGLAQISGDKSCYLANY